MISVGETASGILRSPKSKVFLSQDRAWKEEFHQNMFDAVALGMMATI